MIKIEKVDSFIHLGVLITIQSSVSEEIKARIVNDDKSAGLSLKAYLRSKKISRRTKIPMYKTIQRPTVTYGCKTWVHNAADVYKLEV